MEENKNEVTQTTEENAKTTGTKEKDNNVKTITLSNKIVNSLFAIAALFFMIIVKICTRFGVTSTALRGIMCLLYVSASFVGVVWNYFKAKKPTFEFFFSAAVLAVALIWL